jgi:hypothetical protein
VFKDSYKIYTTIKIIDIRTEFEIFKVKISNICLDRARVSLYKIVHFAYFESSRRYFLEMKSYYT